MITLFPAGSVQNLSPKLRPVRKRRPTRKVTEDATADLLITADPLTPNDSQRHKPVIRNPAPPAASVANIPEGHQEGHATTSDSRTPIYDDGANPFLTAVDLCNDHLCNSNTTPSTERQFYAVSPSTPSQSPHSPHVGQHSITRPRRLRQSQKSGFTGRRRRRYAKDVWIFFRENSSNRSCLFCE